jgi:hypothetical protein
MDKSIAYSLEKLDDVDPNISYFSNVKPLEELPTKAKPLEEFTNSIDENFFGE